jgi:hypothetical protein
MEYGSDFTIKPKNINNRKFYISERIAIKNILNKFNNDK